MKIAELLHTPVTSAPTDSIGVAAELMRDHGIGCVVVTAGTRPLGILTDRDIVVRCSVMGHDPYQCRVENHLSPAPITVHPEATIEDALHLMVAHKVKRLPVVEGEHLVGVVSFSDIAAALDVPLHELLNGMGAARRAGAPKLVTP